jgi:hypothetical protein
MKIIQRDIMGLESDLLIAENLEAEYAITIVAQVNDGGHIKDNRHFWMVVNDDYELIVK